MNKTLKNLALALAMCGALCGTAIAAPKGNPPPKGNAPTAMKAPANKPAKAKPAPARQATKSHGDAHRATVRVEPRHEVARHNSHPPTMHHAPPPRHHHEPGHHHGDTLHTEDWCEIGASLLGGLIGGLIGASI